MNDAKKGTLKTAALIFALALALRAAFVLLHGPAPLVAEMNAYWDAAGDLLAGEGFHAGHGFRAFLPPGYAFFLAAVRMCGGDPLAARLVQAVLGAATAALTYFYARAAFGARVGVIAGIAFAAWPPSLVFGDFVLTEALFTFLLMVGIVAWGDGSSWPRAAAAALILAAATATREIALYFFPFIAVCYLLRKDTKLALKSIVAAIVLFSLIAPWTIRNYRLLGGFVPVTSKSAVDLFIYNHNSFKQILHNESDQQSENKLFADARSEFELTRLARRRALAWIVAHPALFLFKGVRTEMNYLGLERDFFQHQMYGYYPPLSRPATLALVPVFLIPSALALPLAFAAALRWRSIPALGAGVYIIIFYLLITFAAYSFTRQRYPLTPIFVALAAGAVADFPGTLRWLRGRAWATTAVIFFVFFLLAAWALETVLDLPDFVKAGAP